MAVTKPKNSMKQNEIRQKLALATCSLLAVNAQADENTTNWTVDFSLLNYEEKEDRISVSKLIANANGQINDSNRLKFDVGF